MPYDEQIQVSTFRLLGIAAALSLVVLPARSDAQAAGPHVKSGCSVTLRPHQGLQRLVDRLAPGQTGCLAPGVYDARRLLIGRSGTESARITLRSLDRHDPATIRGLVWLRDSANFWTFDSLRFDGRNATDLPSPLVNGDRSVWRNVDVTNYAAGTGMSGGGICFSLGSTDRYGAAVDTIIEQSRIHDCGISDNHNHGIYVTATGGRTIIRDNWIFRNGDRGIQLFPDAQHVLIVRNVIDGNGSGVIFSGSGSMTSRDVVVVGNIISNSRNRWNVESWYPSGTPVGTGNLVTHNCFWASAPDPGYHVAGGIAPQVGFTATKSNVVQQPRFTAQPHGDLRLAPNSGCKGFGPSGAALPTTG
jgi:hypothetical protein